MRPVAPALAAFVLVLGSASIADARQPTPELITDAVKGGEISAQRGHLLQAYAIGKPQRLPAKYQSSSPWDGTPVLLELYRALPKMKPGPTKREIQATLDPVATATTTCSSSSGNPANETQTAHFYVQYGTIAAASGLDINDYTASLETSWSTEVSSFGWAAPPVAPTPAPGSKYHVRIDNLSSSLYGFVSPSGTHAGLVGNNPNTSWNDVDAYASCMVLNDDYSTFPSPPQASLDSTTGHEFNHSLQFGYGALNGTNAPDNAFVEGGATWMEDEVFDAANDNYNYLWPVFSDGMGDYDASPYPYWITFRGLTERFGTGVAGGGEDVMQRFWELTSQNLETNLGAMDEALIADGTNLADAFHAYAIAVRFLKTCGGSHVLPYCFEEAAAYPSNATAVANATNTISSVGGGLGGGGVTIEDHFSIRYVTLPTSGGPYSVTLQNTSNAAGNSRLRGTVVCDGGSTLTRQPLPAVVADGQSTTLTPVNPTGCTRVILVVTNQTRTSDDPTSSSTSKFKVQTASTAPPPTQTLTVGKSGDGSGTVTSTDGGINCGNDCTETYPSGTQVTLNAAPSTGTFTGWSGGGCSGTGSCVVTMNQAQTVTATFQLDRTLTIDKAGSGSGTVTSSPAGINCGSTCTHDFAHGTAVTLTADDASGSTFTGWAGCDSSNGTTCQVSMTNDKTVTATFQLIRTLTVNKGGTGSGTVTSSPAGINCGNTCTAGFADGTTVTLSAAPASGSTFSGWSGACSGTGSCQVTMDLAKSVTANFQQQPAQTLTVSKSGDGSGTVTSSPPGISCGSTCVNSFAYGTVVTLTASPSSGSTFTGWSGACSGTGSCMVTMTAARNVTATFALVPATPTPEPTPTPTPTPEPTPSDDNPLAPTPPFAPLVDTVAPLVSVSSAPLRANKRGYVRLPIECDADEPADCEGNVRLVLLRSTTAAAARIVARASFDIAAGDTKRVRMRLSKFARRRLARRGRIRVRAVVVVEDAAGNLRTIRRKLTVRPA